MTNLVLCDNYQLSFSAGGAGFVFDDEITHGKSHCMSAVDVVAEFSDKYYFIELKGCRDKKTGNLYNQNVNQDKLKSMLTRKFFDSFVYRYSQGKTNKPIDYICLVNLGSMERLKLLGDITNQLSHTKFMPWIVPIVRDIVVVDEAEFNTAVADCNIAYIFPKP